MFHERHDVQELTARQEIWRGLLQGQRAMLIRLAIPLKKDFGLTLAQYEALLALHQSRGGSLPATELAHELLYSSGSATHLINRLQELGYVSRSRGVDDARTQLVSITQAGSELITRATDSHVEALHQDFEPLIPDADIESLLGFARRLAAREGVRSAPPRH